MSLTLTSSSATMLLSNNKHSLTFPLERDSLKDRTIVTLFIIATGGLLAWAILKPFVMKSGVSDVVQRYTPVAGHSRDASALDRDEDAGLPRPNGGGFGGGDHVRPGRMGAGQAGSSGAAGRGSISRQGGLNS